MGVAPDRSHTRAVWSSDPVTTRCPSGLNATLVTESPWPSSTVGAAPDRSHTRADLSVDPVTTPPPSQLHARARVALALDGGGGRTRHVPHPRCLVSGPGPHPIPVRAERHARDRAVMALERDERGSRTR